MGRVFIKHINQDFFKTWTSKMSYVLGYIVADGCITVSKERKNPFTFNITSLDVDHLSKIKEVLGSEHKMSKKPGGGNNFGFQIHIRNPVIAQDLINLGIYPRKTHNLYPIKVPKKYFSDFVRGFFDGDGTVYVYEVNKVPQIKAGFICTSLSFLADFNQKLCKALNIPTKAIHRAADKRRCRMATYYIDLYIDDCEKLYHFMYKDDSGLCLSRKKLIFEKWKSMKRRKYRKQNYPSKVGWCLNRAPVRTSQ